MTYVPVYIECSDNKSNNVAHTSSRRGKVTSAAARINTHFGTALDVEVSSQGFIKKIDETHIEERINYFKQKGDAKKITYWESKLTHAKEMNNLAELNEKVIVDMDLTGLQTRTPNKFKYRFTNGNKSYFFISQNLIDIFDNWEAINNMLPQLKVAKALEENNKNND